MGDDGGREWLYPELSQGRLWWGRLIVGWALIALFVALPLVSVDGKPAVLLDIVAREFTFFGTTLYPTDTILLLLLLLGIFISIALVTAVFGRVWCGWACPQTVYLEFVYRPIERLFEGRASQRKRRDEREATAGDVWRKIGKFTVYAIVSLALSHTFLAYFVGWSDLVAWMGDNPANHWGVFLAMAGTTALILFDFGYFREQMCTTVCPYARLQSVLIDSNSMIVSYDENRGEPRGRRNREQRRKEAEGAELELGDCIDCGACVRTCPTGIDIRDGLQMECVNCTQCIDACNDIMRSIDKPEGLIRLTSENELQGNETRLVRPRVVMYALLAAVLFGAFGFMLATRHPLEVDITRPSGEPFRTLPSGKVANRLEFRVRNATSEPATVRLKVTRPEGAGFRGGNGDRMELAGGEMKRLEGFVVVPSDSFDATGSAEATFTLTTDTGVERQMSYRLLGPSNRSSP